MKGRVCSRHCRRETWQGADLDGLAFSPDFRTLYFNHDEDGTVVQVEIDQGLVERVLRGTESDHKEGLDPPERSDEPQVAGKVVAPDLEDIDALDAPLKAIHVLVLCLDGEE